MVQIIGCTKVCPPCQEEQGHPPPGFITSVSFVESNLLRTSAYLEKARFIQKKYKPEKRKEKEMRIIFFRALWEILIN